MVVKTCLHSDGKYCIREGNIDDAEDREENYLISVCKKARRNRSFAYMEAWSSQ